MRGSLKVFSWFNIPVYIHWSFSLLLLFLLWDGFRRELDWEGMIWQFALFAALFACVLLHEFGHSLMARRYGVQTQDIILTPIGGIARLERMPEKPKQELLVAIAGPLVNVVIAILILALSRFIFFSGEIEWWFFKSFIGEWLSFSSEEGELSLIVEDSGIQISGWLLTLPALFAVNVMMVVFNLIPAFPMDGGRILRSLLAMQLGRSRATKVASIVGQVIAVAFVAIGLYTNAFTLALIGVFVFSTARSENTMVQLEYVLGRYQVRDVVRSQFTRLMWNDWMRTPIDMMTHSLERHFLVFDIEGNLVGALEEDQIAAAAKKQDYSSEIRHYLRAPVSLVYEHDSLRNAHYLLRQKNEGILAVVNSQMELIGVIDQTGLDNFMKLAR